MRARFPFLSAACLALFSVLLTPSHALRTARQKKDRNLTEETETGETSLCPPDLSSFAEGAEKDKEAWTRYTSLVQEEEGEASQSRGEENSLEGEGQEVSLLQSVDSKCETKTKCAACVSTKSSVWDSECGYCADEGMAPQDRCRGATARRFYIGVKCDSGWKFKSEECSEMSVMVANGGGTFADTDGSPEHWFLSKKEMTLAMGGIDRETCAKAGNKEAEAELRKEGYRCSSHDDTNVKLWTEGNIVKLVPDGADFLRSYLRAHELFWQMPDEEIDQSTFMTQASWLMGPMSVALNYLTEFPHLTDLSQVWGKTIEKGIAMRILAWRNVFADSEMDHQAIQQFFQEESDYWMSQEGGPAKKSASQVIIDGRTPVGGSHHQKAVVFSHKGVLTAFIGGLDVTVARWDTYEHVIKPLCFKVEGVDPEADAAGSKFCGDFTPLCVWANHHCRKAGKETMKECSELEGVCGSTIEMCNLSKQPDCTSELCKGVKAFCAEDGGPNPYLSQPVLANGYDRPPCGDTETFPICGRIPELLGADEIATQGKSGQLLEEVNKQCANDRKVPSKELCEKASSLQAPFDGERAEFKKKVQKHCSRLPTISKLCERSCKVCGEMNKTGFLKSWVDRDLQIQGPAALDILNSFSQRWADKIEPSDTTIHKYYENIKNAKVPLPPPTASLIKQPTSGTVAVQILRTYACSTMDTKWFAKNGEISIYKAVLKAVHRARNYIIVEDQYGIFVQHLFDALAAALYRGVRYLIVFLAPATSEGTGNGLAHGGGFKSQDKMWGTLQRKFGAHRVRIYAMNQHSKSADTLIHSKTVLVDDRWLLVGSANINARSYTADSEIGAAIVDKATVKNPDGLEVGKAVFEFRNRMLWDFVEEDTTKKTIPEIMDLLSAKTTAEGWGNVGPPKIINLDLAAKVRECLEKKDKNGQPNECYKELQGKLNFPARLAMSFSLTNFNLIEWDLQGMCSEGTENLLRFDD